MAWWSTLGKIGLAAAAPFTGGATLALMPAFGMAVDAAGRYADQKSAQSKMQKAGNILSGVAGTAGAAAAGSADARHKQDLLNSQIYGNAMQGALGRGRLDLDQREFAMKAPGQRVSQVARGDLMRNVTDFSMGGPGQGSGAERMSGWTPTGGMRPSALGPDSKEAARLMIAQHLEKLQKPEQFADIKYPETPQLSKAGWLENILGGVGVGGGMLGSIMDVLKKQGSGGTPVGNDLPSQGGITGNMPRPNFLPGVTSPFLPAPAPSKNPFAVSFGG